MRAFLEEPDGTGITRREAAIRAIYQDKPETALRIGYGDITKDIPERSESDLIPPRIRHMTTGVNSIFRPGYIIAPVHAFIGAIVDRWIAEYLAGQSPKYHLSMPPQHGKTWTIEAAITRLFGIDPSTRISYCSYAQDLARRSSRKVREFILDEKTRSLFPSLSIKADNKSVDEWETTAGGRFSAWGVGKGAGVPVDGLFIDDLVKGYSEFLSKAHRERRRSWLSGILGARLHNRSGVFSIGTRWGVGDGVDDTMELIPGDWQVWHIPAIAIEGERDPLGRKPGEALWPEQHSAEGLIAKMDAAGVIQSAAVYQQRPIDRAGQFFRGEWRYTDPASWPHGLIWYRYWDLGFSESDDSDESAGALVAVDDQQNIYIRDVITRQKQWPIVSQTIKDTYRTDGGNVHTFCEAIGTQKGYVSDLRASGYNIVPRKHKGEKAVEAGLWQSQQWSGKVNVPNNANWTQRLIDQAHAFPGGKHDDIIDAITGAIIMHSKFKPITVGGRG